MYALAVSLPMSCGLVVTAAPFCAVDPTLLLSSLYPPWKKQGVFHSRVNQRALVLCLTLEIRRFQCPIVVPRRGAGSDRSWCTQIQTFGENLLPSLPILTAAPTSRSCCCCSLSSLGFVAVSLKMLPVGFLEKGKEKTF